MLLRHTYVIGVQRQEILERGYYQETFKTNIKRKEFGVETERGNISTLFKKLQVNDHHE